MVTVRRASKEDEKEIFRFIKRAYIGRWKYKIPHRWRWQFVDNPFITEKNLPITIAVHDNGDVVGQICTMVERIKIGEQVFRVGWSVDNFVLPDFRKQGIASALQEANFQYNDIFLSLSMADIVRQIKVRLGMVPLPPVNVYRRYHQLDKDQVRHAILARYAPVPGFMRKIISGSIRFLLLDRILALFSSRLLQLKDRKLSGTIDPDLDISACERFPEELGHLWKHVSQNFDAIIQRDYEYLNWKFVDQPHMNYKRFIARRDGEIYGYMVVRVGRPPEPKIGIMADIFVDPFDTATLSSLLSFAVVYFRQHKVKEILIATSVPAYQKILDVFGFTKEREEIPMIHIKNLTPDLQKIIKTGAWFFSTSDHDFDQYPLAR